MLSKLSNPFSLFFGPIYRPGMLFNRDLIMYCRWREWEGRWEKLLLNVGETDSPEPVTGVTGCDGLHVTGADGHGMLVTAWLS